MDNVRIDLSSNLVNASVDPTIRIEPDMAGYRVVVSFGILATKVTAPPTSGQVKSQRETELGANIFNEARVSIGLTPIASDDAGSILTFIVKAKLGTKVPGTGSSSITVFEISDLDGLLK
ncbi:hypothetical protein [Ohtaekwangia koreensis]|uniref:Uncharacterized protein n=1 Tax=Ohtaekwangia koreensis TaxID=688867 RepID=A0A1T5ISV0_9BACT|nr:hypothetical protein [Ohtaekwangia koreensis]SKC42229.1 hypothetical protein SAMN05660236_0361 [Ohtaekwangia koreensis]